MPTVSVNLDVEQYVQVNTAFNPMVLQAHNDSVRITLSETKPARGNAVYHLLGGKDAPLHFNSIDTNVWALSVSDKSSLIVSETEPFPIAVHDALGNPIFSFKGALSTYDSDVNSKMVNEHLRIETGVTDTLTVAAAAGDYDIEVTTGANFPANTRVIIDNGVDHESGSFKVVTQVLNVLTLDKPLEHDHAIGATVEIIIKSMNVNGSVTRQIFSIAPPPTEIWHIYRLTIAMVHTGQPSDDKFGDLAKLTNGLVLRQEDGFNRNLSIWRDNTDIVEDTGVDLRYSAKAGGGLFGTAARWTFKRAGTVVTLDGSLGDVFKGIVQDNLVGLSDLEIKLQGHVEGA